MDEYRTIVWNGWLIRAMRVSVESDYDQTPCLLRSDARDRTRQIQMSDSGQMQRELVQMSTVVCSAGTQQAHER